MQVLAPYLKNLWVLHEILATYPYQLFVHQLGHPSANFSLSFFSWTVSKRYVNNKISIEFNKSHSQNWSSTIPKKWC